MHTDLVLGSLALAMFIICPRMAGMVHVISNHSHASVYLTATIGSVIAIPLVLLIVFTFTKFGIWGALGFCVLTDLISVFIMKEISAKASLETLIIALFVIVGVKVAPLLSEMLFK